MTVFLSIGKIRSLQQCATPRGALAVLALDHRNNLRQLLNPSAPSAVSAADLSSFKRSLVKELAPVSSAVLLDAEFGAAQCIAGQDLPGKIGLVVSLEASGYSGESTARVSRILPEWSVEKTKRMGASAIKLLVYYHPEASTARQMEDLVEQVAADCQKHEILLFLETLSYSLDPAKKKLSPDERRWVVIETARRLTPLGGDILKAEFPLDVAAGAGVANAGAADVGAADPVAQHDEQAWRLACQELSQASVTPWVLLSGSADYETFLRQVASACQAGASGVAVGRAVWRETTDLNAAERRAFLEDTARERMARLTALVDALARPWTDFYTPLEVTPEWYKG